MSGGLPLPGSIRGGARLRRVASAVLPGLAAMLLCFCERGPGVFLLELGERDVLEAGGVTLIESSLRFMPGATPRLSFRVTQATSQAQSGTARVELVHAISGETLTEVSVPVGFEGPEALVDLALPGFSPQAPEGDPSRGVLRVHLQLPGGTLVASRGLPQCISRPHLRVMGQGSVYAGERGLLRLVAKDAASGAPMVNATARVVADPGDQPEVLWTGVTDAFGQAEADLDLRGRPAGPVPIQVEIAGEAGETQVLASMTVVTESRILLTTDKPIYQPEQTIQARALSLGYPALRPRGDVETVFEIYDAKGTKVGKETTRTNAYGIASTTFRLARIINHGAWRITARVGESVQEKTVTVSRYALPKFRVTVGAEEPWYRPGQTLTGTVRAEYFFGEKVVGGRVEVKALQFDVGWNLFATVQGTTDAEGAYTFQVTLPDTFVGLPLEQGNAFVYLEASVIDTADHEERAASSAVVASDALSVQLVPEANPVAPGVENVFYVVTADPVGVPLACTVAVSRSGQAVAEVVTDAQGLGELRYTPPSASFALDVEATCEGGPTRQRTVTFEGGAGSEVEGLLLRTDAPVYRVGDTAQLTVQAPRASDRVYLDVVSHNRTVDSQILTVEGGQATVALDLGPDLAGAVQLRVYYLTAIGDLVRNQRLIYVEGADALRVTFTPGQDPYRPGDVATVDLQVTDGEGVGVPAAVGVNVVDEAVFALTEFKPGLEQTYFKLEEELLTPRYQVKTCTLSDVLGGAEDPGARDRAEVFLAASGGEVTFPLDVSTPAGLPATAVSRDVVVASLGALTAALRAADVRTAAVAQVTVAGAALVDPWGQPFRATVVDDGWGSIYVMMRTAGPDEVWDTADDGVEEVEYVPPAASEGSGLGGCFGGPKPSSHGADAGWGNNSNGWNSNNSNGGWVDASSGWSDGASADGGAAAGDGGAAAGPTVRDDFPETLYTDPAVITDDQGRHTLQLQLADSITTWRMSGLANTLGGQVGSGTAGLRVFQPFFVDLDLPAYLMSDSELTVRAAVYNYSDEIRTVEVVMEAAAWMQLLDGGSRTVVVAPQTAASASFRLQVLDVGWHDLQVTATDPDLADAVRRRIEVRPNGAEVARTFSGSLTPGQPVAHTVTFPPEAIAGANELLVKIYPGLLSQVVEGLDSLLKVPYG